MDVDSISKNLPWAMIVGLFILLYVAWFIGRNYEGIVHNMSNPCVLTPMNFGACY